MKLTSLIRYVTSTSTSQKSCHDQKNCLDHSVTDDNRKKPQRYIFFQSIYFSDIAGVGTIGHFKVVCRLFLTSILCNITRFVDKQQVPQNFHKSRTNGPVVPCLPDVDYQCLP